VPQFEVLSSSRVTSEATADIPTDLPKSAPSTAGMTTKVVKGSAWTLAGSVLPLAVSFITTPIIIRLLGSEAYGVLLLVGLFPIYFSFADLGMGIASTKFASEAFADNDEQREARIVRTGGLIALMAASLTAAPVFLFADVIVSWLNVPGHLTAAAVTALRLTAVSFVFSILSGVLNAPQLSRLRMDLNAVINAAIKVMLGVGTTAALFLGGGIVAAAAFGLVVSGLGLVAHIVVSRGLLRRLLEPTIDTVMVGPMLRFGFGLMITSVASLILTHIEKLIITGIVSVASLAHYSVAFTFAMMATTFSWGMVQSLIPAFSQLSRPGSEREYSALFSRSLRLNIVWLLPTLTVLFVIARPFFTIWAGEEFGPESTLPFYILLIGLFFNILSYVPYSMVVASGRSGLLAKLYWMELVPYIVISYFLIANLGIVGAAAAWSVRVFSDTIFLSWFAYRIVGPRGVFNGKGTWLFLASIFLSFPPLFVVAYPEARLSIVAVTVVALTFYGALIWRRFVLAEERAWILNALRSRLQQALPGLRAG
jgi:O-antigen/teichoic acid export membrane protein